MDRLTEIIKALPEMMAGKELLSAMTVLPHYDDSIRAESEAVRLMALSDLYQIYLPSQMSLEIYSKLYLPCFVPFKRKAQKSLSSSNTRITRLFGSRNIAVSLAAQTALRS